MNHIEANQSETTSREDKFRAYLRETAGSLYTSLRRLFTVLHVSVRTSISSALRDGLPSCMSVKTTRGAGAVWEEARKIEGL